MSSTRYHTVPDHQAGGDWHPKAFIRLAEPAADPLSEAELSLIWEGQRYPPGALTWTDGSSVSVIQPGRKTGGPGPDFRDALVFVDGSERVGDVELHVRASYFLQHGHQYDPAYDRVILHAVFLDDAGGFSPLPGGGRVPVASFAPWVRTRAADIASWSRAPALWREPCQSAVARLGEEAVREELARAGRARILARSRVLGLDSLAEGPDQALWVALMEALGYGGDREGFRRLAGVLPLALLVEVMRREGAAAVHATLLSAAGLGRDPGTAGAGARLSPPLRRTGRRPANRPEKRLAAAATIVLAAGGGLAARAVTDVRRAVDATSLLRAWTVAPLGPARAAELLLNAVLPLTIAIAPELETRCLDLAAGLRPVPPYGKTRFLESNLAPAPARRPVSSALSQQGLLALHADWCSQGGCGRCPLS